MDERNPSDVADEKESIAEAAERIDEFFEYWKDEIKATIQSYADGPAEDLWWNLRERFWTRERLPVKRPRIIPTYDPENP